MPSENVTRNCILIFFSGFSFFTSFLSLKHGSPWVVSDGDCFFSCILPTQRSGGEVVVLLASHHCTGTGLFYSAHKNLLLWNACHLIMLFFLPDASSTDCPIFLPHHGRTQYLTDPVIPPLNTVLVLSVFSIHINDSSNTMASQFLISSLLTF